jgi:translation initiation factor 1A
MPKRGGRGGGRGRQKGALKRELVYKTDGETEYAQVTRMLGNSRVETLCIADGRTRQCKIRGSLRVWIQAQDIVLISLRDFQDTKADVIWKYTADEARKLKRSGALPEATKLNETDSGRTFIFIRLDRSLVCALYNYRTFPDTFSQPQALISISLNTKVEKEVMLRAAWPRMHMKCRLQTQNRMRSWGGFL